MNGFESTSGANIELLLEESSEKYWIQSSIKHKWTDSIGGATSTDEENAMRGKSMNHAVQQYKGIVLQLIKRNFTGYKASHARRGKTSGVYSVILIFMLKG